MGKTNGPILFFDTVTCFGGSKKVTVKLAEKINQTQKVVIVDSYGNCREFVDEVRKNGIELKILKPGTEKGVIGGKGITRLLNLLFSSLEMFTLIRLLKKTLEEIKPRIIVVNCEKALFLAEISSRFKIPVVYYLMALLEKSAFTNFLWRRTNLVIGMSQKIIEHFLKVRPKPKRMAIIYNAVDPQEIEKLSTQSSPVGDGPALKILYPANIGYYKAQHIAAEAVGKFKQKGNDVQLWLSGQPPRGTGTKYLNSLKELIEKSDLKNNVSFLGWQANIISVMNKADIIMLTSFREGMPCCLMEAMYLQKPVIATNVGGVSELVRDGIDGILVKPGDADAICAALEKMAAPEIRKKMGAAGRERILSKFTLDKQVSDFMEQLNTIN